MAGRIRTLMCATLVAAALTACGDEDKQFAGFSCRASNIKLGECLQSNGIVGHEHRVIAELIFDGDYKYRAFPKGGQCYVEYNIDAERAGKRIKKHFTCKIPERK